MEFKIIDLIKFYFKSIMFNLAILIIVFLLGVIYVLNIYEDKYVATTTFMIGACFDDCSKESELNIEFNKKVLSDYMRLVKTNKSLEEANNRSKLKYSVSKLYSMVDVSYDEDTEYVKISVISDNKDDCAKLSYNLYKVLEGEITRIFDLNNIHLVDTDQSGSIKIDKDKLIVFSFFISLIITIITTLIRFIYFLLKKENEELSGNEINS